MPKHSLDQLRQELEAHPADQFPAIHHEAEAAVRRREKAGRPSGDVPREEQNRQNVRKHRAKKDRK